MVSNLWSTIETCGCNVGAQVGTAPTIVPSSQEEDAHRDFEGTETTTVEFGTMEEDPAQWSQWTTGTGSLSEHQNGILVSHSSTQ